MFTPSETQRLALTLLLEGHLHYWNGGWWALLNETSHSKDGYEVPARYVTTHTIKALERRGIIERVASDDPAWNAPRRLTATGQQLAGTPPDHGDYDAPERTPR